MFSVCQIFLLFYHTNILTNCVVCKYITWNTYLYRINSYCCCCNVNSAFAPTLTPTPTHHQHRQRTYYWHSKWSYLCFIVSQPHFFTSTVATTTTTTATNCNMEATITWTVGRLKCNAMTLPYWRHINLVVKLVDIFIRSHNAENGNTNNECPCIFQCDYGQL